MPARSLIFRSFRTLMPALVLGLIALVLSAILVAVIARVRTQIEHQAALQLKSAANTAPEMMRSQGDQLTGAADVLTADPDFKTAVASGDVPAVLAALGEHKARLGSDAVIVLSRNGELIASTSGPLSVDTRTGMRALVGGQEDTEPLHFFRLIDTWPFQIVLAPVLAPDPIGWIAVSGKLDDRLAADMARSLGADVSFVSTGIGSTVNVASSLPADRRPDIAALIARAPPATPFYSGTAGNRLLTWANTIPSNNGRVTLVVQRSIAEALRPYELLQRSILALLAAALVVAWGFCILLARRHNVQPADAARDSAEHPHAGEHTTHQPHTDTVELPRLEFDNMRAVIAEREAEMRHPSLHDGLTHLPTLTRISEVLQQLLLHARSVGEPVTVCLVELQHLQDITALLGHAATDEVLWEVARRLTDGNITERVARVATERFLVLRQGKNAQQAERLANSLARQLASPVDYSGISLQLDSRIGVAVFPDDGDLPSELLQRAELALYGAVERGVTVGMYVRGDDESHQRRLTILSDLGRAIGSEQLELYYQPKVAAGNATVLGCEALLRWHHPVRGFVLPSEFIPVAERIGMIRTLTFWVLGSALKQLRRWQDAGSSLDVAINVSASDLKDPGFVEQLSTLLLQTGADPRHLVLEVTETAAMNDLSGTSDVMAALRILGIRFAIDHFGTGLSSPAALRQLGVDEIKIDRSFIAALQATPGDDVIVRSTIALAHALGSRVVAVGVEQAVCLESLAGMGCDAIQGYIVAKPMPEGKFTRWLAERHITQVREPDAAASMAPTASVRQVS